MNASNPNDVSFSTIQTLKSQFFVIVSIIDFVSWFHTAESVQHNNLNDCSFSCAGNVKFK